jgi:D-alanyl-D-alanine carboxypeptidase
MYEARFPIRRMEPVDKYGGSDDASMAADNTSAFNCRPITGTTDRWSNHSYGRAIDINTIENPYVKGGTVLPPAGAAYLDRGDVRPGMIVAGDVVTTAFAAEGFGWGGDYTSLKDYQHFERAP